MEEANNITKIPILGIARSGSDRTCLDGKCNEIIGLEYKDGSYYPYAPTLYDKMNIEGAERVWIHKTSLQENWLKLQQGKMYWTKEETNDWKEIGEIGDFSFNTPIDFTGNLISLGNAIYFLFKNDKYIRFTREDLKLNLAFSVEQDKWYGIRTRYRWDVLAGMEKTQSKGFAETICGLYNKLDNKAIEENKLVGAAYVCYAFRLYDGTYIYASSPILLKNFDYTKQYYKEVRSCNNSKDPVYDFEKNKYATPLFGTIYGQKRLNLEFGAGSGYIEVGVANLASGALKTAGVTFCGLRTTNDFEYGSKVTALEQYDYLKNANLHTDVYRDFCSWVYKGQKYEWTKAQENDKNVKSVDEVFSFNSSETSDRDFNTEEMSCISCIADTEWGTEGQHDWCDVYAFRKASSISARRFGSLDEKLKDFILSVDVFITRPILPVESGEQETIDNFQCVEHRKIKPKKDFLDELHTSQRAFYKVMEIPFDDCIEGGRVDFTDTDFVNAAFKNITSKETLVTYSNHTMLYNISYNFNQKVHIADFKYHLYRPSLHQLINYKVKDNIKAYISVRLLIDGKEYITKPISHNVAGISLYSTLYYPDTRAVSATIYIQKDGSNEYYFKEFKLQPSDVIDYAYYEDENGESITKSFGEWERISIEDFVDKYNEVVENSINNIMRVSNVGNPIVFPYTYSYQISNGDIIGMSSNAVALSQGQFGEHKLFVFTTDGIWAMKTDTTGKGFYLDQDPVSREVCNNRNSICQIDGGIVFSSEKGLMVISGSEATLLSEELNGKPSGINNRVYNTSTNNINLVILKDNHSNIDFREYLSEEGTFVTFLYKKNKLIIYNNNFSYCYLFDIKKKITTKLSYKFTYSISDYPNDKIVSVNSIYEFPIESSEEYIDTLLQTRPIKLGSHDFKSNYRTVVRGEFGTQEAKMSTPEYIDLKKHQAKSKTITIEQAITADIELNTFNQEPIEVSVEYNAPTANDVYLDSYLIGEKILSPKYDSDGFLVKDSEGNIQFEEITITEHEYPDQVLYPVLNSGSKLINNNGSLTVYFGIKRDKPYRNMQIINPIILIGDTEGDSFELELKTGGEDNLGIYKDDDNKIYPINTSIPYKSSYYIIEISNYEKYCLRSFSFIKGYVYNMFIPYVTSKGIVRLKNVIKYINDYDAYENPVTLTDIVLNKKVSGYARLTYTYSGFITVDDYDNNGKTDGEDILTWIKDSLTNTNLLSDINVEKKISLKKDTYYKYITKPHITEIKVNSNEVLFENNIYDGDFFTLKTIPIMQRQYLNGVRVEYVDGTANSYNPYFILPQLKYEYIDGQKYAIIKFNSPTSFTSVEFIKKELWTFYAKNITLYNKTTGEIVKVSALDRETIKIPIADDEEFLYISEYPSDFPSYAYESYLPVITLFELGVSYEIAIPYVENGRLYGKRYAFKVKDELDESFVYNDLIVIGAKTIDLPIEDPVSLGAKKVDDIYAWLEDFATNENYVIPEYSKVIEYDPEFVEMKKNTNYDIVTHEGNVYNFKYIEDDKMFSYEDLLNYVQSDKIVEQDENEEVLFYYYDEDRVFTEEEFQEYLLGSLDSPPKYIPYNVNLIKANYIVYIDGLKKGTIVSKDTTELPTADLIGRIDSGFYDEVKFITDDTMIEGLYDNVIVIDKIIGTQYSFHSNYASGRISYGELKKAYENNELEPYWNVDYEYYLTMQNGKLYTISYNNEIYNIIYSGSNKISIGELIENLPSYAKNDNPLRIYKHIGLYVFGSTDCEKWGFLGGTERAGDDLCDILTKIERISVKYIKLVFVGNISADSHIDAIEIQASKKYNNKIR